MNIDLKEFFTKYRSKASPTKAKPRRIGTVYSTNGGKKLVFKNTKKDIQKSSKQLGEEKKWIGQQELIPHPLYSFDILYELYEHCESFSSCVNQISEDTAGLGYKIILKKDATESKEELQKINTLLEHPNPKQSFRQILTDILQCRGIMGYAGFEIIRNVKKEIVEMYPVRGTKLFIHEDRNKYCQKINNKKVWFKDFGYEKYVNKDNGTEGTSIPFKQRANELIFFGTDYGKSTYYPIPKILPAIASVICLLEIKAYNLSFFSNYSVPAYAVMLEGDWDEDAQKFIVQFLDTEVKGSKNQNKTLVLQIPDEGSVTFEPLSVDVKEGSFRAYQNILEDDILLAYSMPPYRLGKTVVGRLGGTNIKEATIIYKQSVIEPLQELLENIINRLIIEQGLDCHSYIFKFNDIDTRDLEKEVERYYKLIGCGVLTPNQTINLLGVGENYPDGDKHYINKTLIEVGTSEEMAKQEDFTKAVLEFKNDIKKITEKEE